MVLIDAINLMYFNMENFCQLILFLGNSQSPHKNRVSPNNIRGREEVNQHVT